MYWIEKYQKVVSQANPSHQSGAGFLRLRNLYYHLSAGIYRQKVNRVADQYYFCMANFLSEYMIEKWCVQENHTLYDIAIVSTKDQSLSSCNLPYKVTKMCRNTDKSWLSTFETCHEWRGCAEEILPPIFCTLILLYVRNLACAVFSISISWLAAESLCKWQSAKAATKLPCVFQGSIYCIFQGSIYCTLKMFCSECRFSTPSEMLTQQPNEEMLHQLRSNPLFFLPSCLRCHHSCMSEHYHFCMNFDFRIELPICDLMYSDSLLCLVSCILDKSEF